MHFAVNPKEPVKEVPDIVTVPSKFRIPLGVFIGVLAFLCGAFAVVGILAAFLDNSVHSGDLGIVAIIVSMLLLAGMFLFRVSARIFRGRDEAGKLASPRVLRIASYVSLILALVIFLGVLTGHDPTGMIAVLIYGGLFLYLRELASQREKSVHNHSPDPTPSSIAYRAGHDTRLR